MKVLVIGSGGREHALVWKLAQSPKVEKIYAAPGNPGMADLAECIPFSVTDVAGLKEFAIKEGIGLTVVGPEAPLIAGLSDQFTAAGLKVFGPSQKAAEIEGSKALAKEIMQKYGIPTAEYQAFTDSGEAIAYIQKMGAPIVVKADGLAAGKGVIVAPDVETAITAVKEIMDDKVFGDAGARVIIEEFLEGEEVSVLAFTDGEHVVPMVSAQDHKRIYDGDEGPNTGGMGAYSPAPVYTDDVAEITLRDILLPTINGLKEEGRTYQGVIYAGLMVTKKGVKVLEYNARFGDPETQPVLMRLDTDLVDIIESILAGQLDRQEIKWSEDAAVCVVVSSQGYPGNYPTGYPIKGLNQAGEGAYVFHAGTAFQDGEVVTSGGRVLGVTAKGSTISEAIDRAYQEVDKISFQGAFFRKDIGKKALHRPN